MIAIPTNRLSLGRIIVTPAARRAVQDANQMPAMFLAQHVADHWGADICPKDKYLNDQAMTDEGRLLSAYLTSKGVKLWIITEADRSATTILLPEEY